jgi:CHRD domain
MHKLRLASIAIAVLSLGAYAARAESPDHRTHFKADLVGFQENPSLSTSGHGHVDIRIDEDAQTIQFELTYDDLEGVGTTPFVSNGVVLFAHIHVAARGVNGGVAVFFCGGGGKPTPCPTPSGTVTGTIAASEIVGPATQGINPGEPTAFEELVRAIRSGFAYANVHTTRWTGGEIRGQLRPHEKN